MNKKNKEKIKYLLKKYKNSQPDNSILVGYDGFLDHIIKVVDKRYNKNKFSPIESIPEFVSKIKAASSKSTNIELYPRYKKIGGNSLILSDSLTELETPVYLIGALGKNKINPIFSNLVNKCKQYYSISNPGETMALEFKDGKIMLGILKSINHISYQKIIRTVKKPNLLNIVRKVKVISFLNWTMIVQMNKIIENFIKLFEKNNIRDKYLFFDLADFSKRTDKDIMKLFNILKYRLENYNVILGLNKKEAEMIYKFHINNGNSKSSFRRLTKDILKQLNLDIVLIHFSKKAAIRTKTNFYTTDTIYTENPIISTGAGDHFNAGFLSGFLRNFSIKESLLLAVINSSYYVSTGKTGTISDLDSFLNNKL